jgi:tetratricopeptide (TPR) repeat protein
VSIHDVIRDEAIKKFNSKDVAYRKEIIHTLSKYFNGFYSEKNFKYLVIPDAINNPVAALYAFIDVTLQNNIVNEAVVNAVIISLKLNGNELFNRHANYVLYQQIANKIYHMNLDNIPPTKKALLYANLVHADFIIDSEEKLSKFEKEMQGLLKMVENDKNHSSLFFIYTYLSQLYIFLGDLQKVAKYLEKAKENISYADSVFNLLQYYYIDAWLCYRLKNIDEGIKAINKYEELKSQLPFQVVNKFYLENLKIRFKIINGQKNKAREDLKKIIKNVAIYYNNTPSAVIGKLEFTKALMYFQQNQYELAEKQCKRALNVFNQAFGGDMIQLAQVNTHIMLGKIYEEKGNRKFALKEYTKCLKYFNTHSHGRTMGLYEYGELLSNLCSLYYKQKNYQESKFYFQKLVANFGLEHELVEKLIKKLPVEYVYQVGGYYQHETS